MVKAACFAAFAYSILPPDSKVKFAAWRLPGAGRLSLKWPE